jgi:hypothetical protein
MTKFWKKSRGVTDTAGQLSRKADEKFDPERENATDEPPDNVTIGTPQGYRDEHQVIPDGGSRGLGLNMYGNPELNSNNLFQSSAPSQDRYTQDTPPYQTTSLHSQTPYSQRSQSRQPVYRPQPLYRQPQPSQWQDSRPSFESNHSSGHQEYDYSNIHSDHRSSHPQYPMNSPINQDSCYLDAGNTPSPLHSPPGRAYTYPAQMAERPTPSSRVWTEPVEQAKKRCFRHGGGYASW